MLRKYLDARYLLVAVILACIIAMVAGGKWAQAEAYADSKQSSIGGMEATYLSSSGAIAIKNATVSFDDKNGNIYAPSLSEKYWWCTYDGTQKKPYVVLEFGSEGNDDYVFLSEGVDYKTVYSNNTNAGRASIRITGIGNYTGTITTYFTIKKFSFNGGNEFGEHEYGSHYADESPTIAIDEYLFDNESDLYYTTYSGSKKTPSLTVGALGGTLKRGRDYSVSYKNNVNVGKAAVTISGIGNYSGSVTGFFSIKRANIKNAKMVGLDSCAYTGKAINKLPNVTMGQNVLTRNKDYTLSYKSNVTAGTATVYAKGKGNYTGTLSGSFTITASLKNAAISYLDDEYYYGHEVKPYPQLYAGGRSLVRGKDYKLLYKNNNCIGKAKVVIVGLNCISGVAERSFKIYGDLDSAKISKVKARKFTGKAIKPKLTVKYYGKKLKQGRDYAVSYKKNVKPGKARITIKGKGYYDGRVSKAFKIKARISKAKISKLKAYAFAGRENAITPKVKVKFAGKKLKLNKDYKLKYSKNNRCGKATVTIKGKGYYTGSTKRTFRIVGDIAEADLSEVSSEVSNGQPLTPEPIVSLKGTALKLNRDYTLSYENNVHEGTATVIVSGKGKYYKGIKRTWFVIFPHGQGDTVTLDEFDLIEPNMTYSNVADIIGGSGTLTYSYSGYEDYYATYEWNGDTGWSGASVSFVNDRVYSKYQYGL